MTRLAKGLTISVTLLASEHATKDREADVAATEMAGAAQIRVPSGSLSERSERAQGGGSRGNHGFPRGIAAHPVHEQGQEPVGEGVGVAARLEPGVGPVRSRQEEESGGRLVEI